MLVAFTDSGSIHPATWLSTDSTHWTLADLAAVDSTWAGAALCSEDRAQLRAGLPIAELAHRSSHQRLETGAVSKDIDA